MPITASDFRNGVTFEYNGNPAVVVEFQHVKPGKGAAFVRTKFKDIITGAVREMSFNPEDKFDNAYVDRIEADYSWTDGDLYYFYNRRQLQVRQGRHEVHHHVLQGQGVQR